MPVSGFYAWRDGRIDQKMRVVADGDCAALLHLRGDAPIPMTCGETKDVLECTRLLAGRHLATVFCWDNGIREFEQTQLLLPQAPRVGEEWVVDRIDSRCESVRRIVSVNSDEIHVVVIARCEGEGSGKGSMQARVENERWVRGGGRRELAIGDWKLEFVRLSW